MKKNHFGNSCLGIFLISISIKLVKFEFFSCFGPFFYEKANNLNKKHTKCVILCEKYEQNFFLYI